MTGDLYEALATAYAEVGIVYREISVNGHWHDTDVEGDKRGRGDGRIKLFTDGAGGIVCNWKTGETRVFFSDEDRALSDAERSGPSVTARGKRRPIKPARMRPGGGRKGRPNRLPFGSPQLKRPTLILTWSKSPLNRPLPCGNCR